RIQSHPRCILRPPLFQYPEYVHHLYHSPLWPNQNPTQALSARRSPHSHQKSSRLSIFPKERVSNRLSTSPLTLTRLQAATKTGSCRSEHSYSKERLRLNW